VEKAALYDCLSHCSFIDTAGQEDIALEKAHDFLANQEIIGCFLLGDLFWQDNYVLAQNCMIA
jgi:hypothetical protein